MSVSALCAWLHMDDFVTHEHRLMCENAFACKIIRLYLKAIIIYLHLVSFRCIGCYRKLEYINVIKKNGRCVYMFAQLMPMYMKVCVCVWANGNPTSCWLHGGIAYTLFFVALFHESKNRCESKNQWKRNAGRKNIGPKVLFSFYFVLFLLFHRAECDLSWSIRFIGPTL